MRIHFWDKHWILKIIKFGSGVYPYDVGSDSIGRLLAAESVCSKQIFEQPKFSLAMSVNFSRPAVLQRRSLTSDCHNICQCVNIQTDLLLISNCFLIVMSGVGESKVAIRFPSHFSLSPCSLVNEVAIGSFSWVKSSAPPDDLIGHCSAQADDRIILS